MINELCEIRFEGKYRSSGPPPTGCADPPPVVGPRLAPAEQELSGIQQEFPGILRIAASHAIITKRKGEIHGFYILMGFIIMWNSPVFCITLWDFSVSSYIIVRSSCRPPTRRCSTPFTCRAKAEPFVYSFVNQ